MSVKLSAYVWDGCSAAGLKGNKLLIMLRLADYASDEGIAFPGIETISRQLGAGRSTVISLINELVRGGWLERQERRLGQRNMSNLYILNVPKLRKAAEKAYWSLHNPQGLKTEPSEPQGPKSGLSESEGLKTGPSEPQGPKSGLSESEGLKTGPSEPQGLKSGLSESEGLKTGPSEPQGPKSGRSESEGLKTGPSDSQGPKYERPENQKNTDPHRPKTGPEPSVNSKQDPTDLKPLCPVSSKPDVETEITEQAIRVLNYLNRVTMARFQKSRSSLENIRARLREDHSEEDLMLLVDYKNEHWRDTSMYEYMRPKTLFRPGKFEAYLSSAYRWKGRGRPLRETWDAIRSGARSDGFQASYQDVDYSCPEGFR
ncbi:conserved phage C-terminal domain-containing protein [Tatumella saanichensis]|uniref:conserved phage C-terminal domain-containing protein n=1 Tax=Tatumella saanichensis TaxID=480813 RepID=UPI0004B5DDE9|nr:conserved phage C-terminal domain-containing protein [Tatumella saanichensis]